MSAVETEVARIVGLFASQRRAASQALSALASSVLAWPHGERTAALEVLAVQVEQPDPEVGAAFALAAGALVESGVSSRPLSKAIGGPLLRAVVAAHPFAERVAEAPEAADDEGSTFLGQRSVTRATLDALVAADVVAANAFFSLDTWYRAAVAAWTRDTPILLRVQGEGLLGAAIAKVEDWSQGAHWLSLLLGVALDAPFVIVLPEIDEAYAMELDGCSDMGQLYVLLSEPLAKPLAKIGAPAVASKGMLAVMRGDGPQATRLVFAAAFRAYPWQAMDPRSKRPEDKRFTWRAPGGSGDLSLPPDFQPRAITPIDGTRVLVVVGPRYGTFRFTREIGGSRMFEALQASIKNVRRLASGETKRWMARILEESEQAARA
jgi:hypothetical protein